MVTAKWQVVLNLPTQHKLSVLQRLIVQQPVQFRPFLRGVAVFVLQKKNGGVVEALQQAILSGQIPAGTEMTQNELAESLGVSRMPIYSIESSVQMSFLYCIQFYNKKQDFLYDKQKYPADSLWKICWI